MLFGSFENIKEVMNDLADTCKSTPEDYMFETIENLLLIKMKVLFGKRPKYLTFKLEKEKMSIKDKNSFLRKENNELRKEVEEIETKLNKLKKEIRAGQN